MTNENTTRTFVPKALKSFWDKMGQNRPFWDRFSGTKLGQAWDKTSATACKSWRKGNVPVLSQLVPHTFVPEPCPRGVSYNALTGTVGQNWARGGGLRHAA